MNLNLPALSIREPWCYAILNFGKTIENRGWSTNYRGRLILHASRTWDEDGYEWLLDHGYRPPARRAFVEAGALGSFVGEVDLLRCVPIDAALKILAPSWAHGPFCWILAHPAPYAEPIPGRGYPGLFKPDSPDLGKRAR